MLRGVKIDYIDTLTDFGLAVLADIKIETPKLKTNYINVPGANGALNLSNYPQGRPTFEMRHITFTLFKGVDDLSLWASYKELLVRFHGREVTVKLPTDNYAYEYKGVIQFGDVTGFNSGKITADLYADPVKYQDIERTIDVSDGEAHKMLLTNFGTESFLTVSSDGDVLVADENEEQIYVSMSAVTDHVIDTYPIPFGRSLIYVAGEGNVTVKYKEVTL